jgi:hypothetical protein
MVVFIIFLFSFSYIDKNAARYSVYQGLKMACLLVFPFLYCIRSKNSDVEKKINKRRMFSSVYILSLPIIYGLGSSNSIYIMVSGAAFFFIPSLLILASRKVSSGSTFKAVTCLGVCCAMLTGSLLLASWTRPYQQPLRIWERDTQTVLKAGGYPMMMRQEDAQMVATLQDIAARHGLMPGTPIIDLTGRLPGFDYILGGQTYVSPYLLSDYEYSDRQALSTLSMYPCGALSSAWVMRWNSPVALDVKILSNLGINFENDYVLEFTFEVVGNEDGEGIILSFYSPKPELAARLSCG